MHQRRRLQSMLAALTPEIRPRQTMQLVINQRKQLIHGILLAAADLPQQPGYFACFAHYYLGAPPNRNVSDYIAPALCGVSFKIGAHLDPTTQHVLLVVFLATIIRSTFGFGEALIAVPLLALTIPIEVAAPVAVLLSITIAAIVVVQDWRKIHFRSTGWLVASTLPGIPLGIALLTSTHQNLVKGVLAIVIVAFSGYSLLGTKPPELHSDSRVWLLGCGFIAGVLGGAYGMNGPPLVIYGAMRRWTPQHFRATLQGYFLPASIVAMAGYWLAGLWVPAVTHYYLLSLPAAVPAIFLCRWLNHRLQGDSFLVYVHAGLICVGALLLVQAIRHT